MILLKNMEETCEESNKVVSFVLFNELFQKEVEEILNNEDLDTQSKFSPTIFELSLTITAMLSLIDSIKVFYIVI